MQQVSINSVDLAGDVGQIIRRPDVEQQTDVATGQRKIGYSHLRARVRERERVREVHCHRAGSHATLATENCKDLAIGNLTGRSTGQPLQSGTQLTSVDRPNEKLLNPRTHRAHYERGISRLTSGDNSGPALATVHPVDDGKLRLIHVLDGNDEHVYWLLLQRYQRLCNRRIVLDTRKPVTPERLLQRLVFPLRFTNKKCRAIHST